jgi:Domain of unknown function (DUF5666)
MNNFPREPNEEPVDLESDPVEPGAVDRESSRPASARPQWVRWAAAAAVVVLVVGGFLGARALSGNSSASATTGAPAPAASGVLSGPGGRPGTFGTIASIAGNTITVNDTASGTSVKVSTSSTTQVTVAKTVGVSAIAGGDRISVTGAISGSTITATRITDMGPQSATSPTRSAGGANAPAGGNRGGFGAGGPGGTGAGGGGFASGTVKSVSGDSIVISTRSGSTLTVKTSASTTVTKNVSSTSSALQVGQSVRVSGPTSSDGSVAATSISEGAGGGFGGFGAGRTAPAGSGS